MLKHVDNIWRRISLNDFSVLIPTQNKDRLCKCQAVCFGQLKANFSCVHDDDDSDGDGNDGHHSLCLHCIVYES